MVCDGGCRVERGVSGAVTELERHDDSLSLLSKQMKLLRHVPLEVVALRQDLANIVAQFPPGNSYKYQLSLIGPRDKIVL